MKPLRSASSAVKVSLRVVYCECFHAVMFNLLALTSQMVDNIYAFFPLLFKQVKSSSIQGYVPVHYPEVALSIEVYHNARKWVKV